MAKNSQTDLIAEVVRPLWDKLIAHNLKRHPERVVNNNVLARKGIEDFTFEDFCDEVRLELQNEDARN